MIRFFKISFLILLSFIVISCSFLSSDKDENIQLSENLIPNGSFEEFAEKPADWGQWGPNSFNYINKDTETAIDGDISVKIIFDSRELSEELVGIAQSWNSYGFKAADVKHRISFWLKPVSIPAGAKIVIQLTGVDAFEGHSKYILEEINGPLINEEWKQYEYDYQQPSEVVRNSYFAILVTVPEDRSFVELNIDDVQMRKHL